MADAKGAAKPLNLGPIWREGMIRQGGTRPVGYPYHLTDQVLKQERKIRPVGLQIDASWWGDYSNEFGDDAFMSLDHRLGDWNERQIREHWEDFGEMKPPPVVPPIEMSSIVVAVHKMPDWALLERAAWLNANQVFYSWVSLATFSGMHQSANDSQIQWIRMAN